MEVKIIIFDHNESISLLEKKHYNIDAQSDPAEPTNTCAGTESNADIIVAGVSL